MPSPTAIAAYSLVLAVLANLVYSNPSAPVAVWCLTSGVSLALVVAAFRSASTR